MNPYVTWYYCDSFISTVLAIITCCLILTQSPIDMKTFRWVLFNIQVSAFVETVFLALVFQPTIEVKPLLNFAPHGFGYFWLRIDTPTLFAISIFFHGVIDGSLAVGLFYRYWILLPLIGINLHWTAWAFMPFVQYTFAGGGCCICCFLSFFNSDTSKKLLLASDPNVTVHEAAITFGGPGTVPWAIILILALSAASICISFILFHSDFILKKSSSSEKTKLMHKSAMHSLIIQLTASFSCSLIPTACCAYQLLMGIDDTDTAFLSWAVPICLPYFSMKTISCSLACILTIRPYRQYVLRKFGFLRDKSRGTTTIVVISRQVKTMSPLSAARFARDDVDQETKWWKEYPKTKYVERARAQNMYENYMSDVWSKPKQLARSASYTNLTYIKDAVHDFPIRKSDSISSLAPSLALPQHYREAERIVHTVPVYKPHVHDWYTKSYSVARYKDTHDTINKPYKPNLHYISPASSHVPYYTFQTKRIFFNEKMNNSKSYLRESQKYLDRYVGSRLKADDFANRFAYSAYEWRKPQDHAFNRHFMYDQGVTVTVPTGNPVSFYDKQSLRRLYKLTGRFYF